MSEPGPTTALVEPIAELGRLRRYGAELSAAGAALVALVAAGALAVAATRAVELVVVVALVQAAFVLAWVLGAAVVSGGTVSGGTVSGDSAPQEAFDASEGALPGAPEGGLTSEVEVGATRALPESHLATDTDDSALLASGAMPGRIGAMIIGAATAAATDLATMHWAHSSLSPTLGILGLAVPVMFAHQLTRGVVRARVVESLSGIALVVVAVTAVSALLPLRHEMGGGPLVAATTLAGGVAVALGLLVDLIWPWPRFDRDVPRGLSGVVAGAVAGAAVGAYLLRHQARFSAGQGLLCCAGIAAVSALVGVATSLAGVGSGSGSGSPVPGSQSYRAHLLRPVALALLPLMLVAPAAYVLLVNA